MPRFCERCKAEIPPERVDILPDTRVCVKCSADMKGEFDMILVSENLAKVGSLKKNYGGYTVRKRRKPITPLED